MLLTLTTSAATISTLKANFCHFGIPNVMVTTNGPQFSSREYKQFAQQYGFQPIFSSPGYPQSKGHAERTVQTVKHLIKKAMQDHKDATLVLLDYSNTPLDGIQASLTPIANEQNVKVADTQSQKQLIEQASEKCKCKNNPQTGYPKGVL